jgi:Domain of unknown function (DUF1858)
VGHAIIPAGSATFRFDHIAVAGGVALIALVVFAYNIMRSVRPSRGRAVEQKRQSMIIQVGDDGYQVTPASIVADVLASVPGSLETLISYGFKPLADPELRARVASSVTLGMACDMRGVDIQALISDLTALQCEGSWGNGPASSNLQT